MDVPFVKGIRDSQDAQATRQAAQNMLENEVLKCNREREETLQQMEQLGETKISLYADQINDFATNFSSIKNCQISEGRGLDEAGDLADLPKMNLKEWEDIGSSAAELIKDGLAGAGTGALLGWATYGAVSKFGVASTGTAIKMLSGAAAHNATLAFLGGGAVYAGGGGIALGTTVLGGIVAIPALLVAGGLFNSKAKKTLNDAYSTMAEAEKASEELKTAETALHLIRDNARQLNSLLLKLGDILQKRNEEMKDILKTGDDWNGFSQEQKQSLWATVETVNVLKNIIDMQVLTDDGYLTKDIKEAISGGQETVRKLAISDKEIGLSERIRCPKCGELINKSAKFCTYCGERIF